MKLVILEPLGILANDLLKLVSAIGDIEVSYFDTQESDVQTLAKRAADADIIVLSKSPLKKEVLEKCSQLKMISVAFTGVDNIDIDYCHERGIVVCNSPGYSTDSVAELVFGMIIALYRNLIACDKLVRSGGSEDGLTGSELAGKKFGVIGLGAIGKRVAGIANAFGCHVYGFNRSKKDYPYVEFSELDDILSECDIVSLHLSLTHETAGLISKEKLALMKPSAILINTARGGIVDYHALADALNSGELAGAGIDVYETEPPLPAGHPLLNCQGVILSPHMGYATSESMKRRAEITTENICKWIAGSPQNII